MKGEKEVRKLFKGETFGEAALYSESYRTMTVIASEDNVEFFLKDRSDKLIYRSNYWHSAEII